MKLPPQTRSFIHSSVTSLASCKGIAEVNHGVDVVDSRLDVWGKRRKFYQCRGVPTPQTMATPGRADEFVATRFSLPEMQTGATLAGFVARDQLAAFTRQMSRLSRCNQCTLPRGRIFQRICQPDPRLIVSCRWTFRPHTSAVLGAANSIAN